HPGVAGHHARYPEGPGTSLGAPDPPQWRFLQRPLVRRCPRTLGPLPHRAGHALRRREGVPAAATELTEAAATEHSGILLPRPSHARSGIDHQPAAARARIARAR